jgi:soluble lytic murein transglycosylase-like protein
LRPTADSTTPSTAKLDPNILLEIKEKLVGNPYLADGNSRTDWFKVEVKEGPDLGKAGFVAGFYVDPVLRTGRTSAAVTSGLTMRSQPAPDTERIALLNPGTRFTVVRGTTGGTYPDPSAVGSNRSDWFDIEYDSKRGFVAAAFVDLLDPTEVADDPNAILFTYEPTGASSRTASQDNLPAQGIVGVKASEAMAKVDLERVKKHKAKFVEAGKTFNLPPALLAAIASRETRCGNILDNEGFGDHGNAFGIMQVDKRFHSPIETDDGPAGEAHIHQATEILSDKLDGVNRHFEGLSDSQSLQAAVSRYNGGSGRLPPCSDEGTTGGDYMNDVWARARYYAKVEKW